MQLALALSLYARIQLYVRLRCHPSLTEIYYRMASEVALSESGHLQSPDIAEPQVRSGKCLDLHDQACM